MTPGSGSRPPASGSARSALRLLARLARRFGGATTARGLLMIGAAVALVAATPVPWVALPRPHARGRHRRGGGEQADVNPAGRRTRPLPGRRAGPRRLHHGRRRPRRHPGRPVCWHGSPAPAPRCSSSPSCASLRRCSPCCARRPPPRLSCRPSPSTRRSSPMTPPDTYDARVSDLERDPIREAHRQWVRHGWGESADGMVMVTSLVRVAAARHGADRRGAEAARAHLRALRGAPAALVLLGRRDADDPGSARCSRCTRPR